MSGRNRSYCRYNQTMWTKWKLNYCTGRAPGGRPPVVSELCHRLGICLVWIVFAISLGTSSTIAQQSFPDGFIGIDREVQALKQEVLELNRELLQLEQELLYPPDQQLAVFLSLAEDATLTLRSLRVELDGQVIVDHTYTGSESEALRSGGVHKPYVGRLDYGPHGLKAFVAGTRANGAAFQQEGQRNFSKGQGTRYIELRISETGSGHRPELTIDELQR